MFLCKEIYIGSTTQALYQWAKEHLAAVKKCDKSLALGEQYWVWHAMEELQLEFRMAHFTEKDELRLQIEETIIIKHLSSVINRRM